MIWLGDVVRWYAVLVVLTWGWAPLVRLLLPNLPDRGASVSRPLALLGTVWLVWFPASLGVLPYATTLLWGAAGVAAIIGWVVVWRRRGLDASWLGSLAVIEVVSLIAFAFFVWLHGFTPNLVGTEKPMDIAFLSSSALTDTMPPPDPWYSGQPINYYYLGYVVMAAVARMAAVVPTTGFSLALATLFSMTLVTSAGLAFNAVRNPLGRRLAVSAAAVAACMVAVAGNLYAPLALLQHGRETVDAFWWDKAVGIGWRASRIVCDGSRIDNDCVRPAIETINEFPFFSFLLGDLHPHLLALPYTLVALTLALSVATRDRNRGVLTSDFLRVAVSGAAVGALYAMNSWDFPTYLVILLAAVVLGFGPSVRNVMLGAAVTIVGAVVAWAPFFLRFVPPTGAGSNAGFPIVSRVSRMIGFWPGERTSVGEYLTIFGVPYLIALVFLVVDAARGGRPLVPARPSIIGILVALALAAILLGAPVLVLAGVPLVIAVERLDAQHEPGPATFATFLYAIGFALSIVVELLYIRDVFDDRMNTLFKVYYQVWVLFAVASALALAVLWSALTRPSRRTMLAVGGVTATVALAAYPLVASWQWTGHLSRWTGIDGLAYLKSENSDELAAIRWMQQHATPGDRVLEAAGCSYEPNGQLPFNRASAYSGVPAVIGWGNNHQPQWRGGQPELLAEIPQREADVATMFSDPTSPLVDDYGITLLYLGTYETGDWRGTCPVAGPYPGTDKPGYPGPGWEPAYQSDTVRIFRRSGNS